MLPLYIDYLFGLSVYSLLLFMQIDWYELGRMVASLVKNFTVGLTVLCPFHFFFF